MSHGAAPPARIIQPQVAMVARLGNPGLGFFPARVNGAADMASALASLSRGGCPPYPARGRETPRAFLSHTAG